HIGFAYNFQQRSARTIQIHKTVIGACWMRALASVFFHVRSGDANFFLLTINGNRDCALADNWFVELANLVTLWKIWIKIVLAVKFTKAFRFSAKGKCGTNSQLHSFLIEHR